MWSAQRLADRVEVIFLDILEHVAVQNQHNTSVLK